MSIEAFHSPQLITWLKTQMWDLPWLHVNSYCFTREHVLVVVSLLFFHYLRCEIYGENDISVQLTELLGFLSWLCVGKHLREVWRCLRAILLYCHSCHC